MIDKSLCILLVDDNPFDRELVCDSLKQGGEAFHVVQAATRAEFERVLQEAHFDLVLSDFNILGFDGLQVLEFVHTAKPGLPVIIVTGTGSEEVAVVALKRGAQDYVIKTPSHIRRLPETIRAVFEKLRLLTEHARDERDLAAAEAKYRSIFENSVEGIYQSSPQGRYLTANPALARILGYASPQELMEQVQDTADLYVEPDRRQTFHAALEQQPTIADFVSQVYRRDGRRAWISENARAVRDEAGALLYYEGSVLDVNERKQAEQLLRESLTEKEAMLREIHHRVKNNLAVVSSLLDMQARRSQDKVVRDEFQISQQRILAMAQIHEQLYRSKNLAQIDMREYLTFLGRSMLSFDMLSQVEIQIQVDDVTLEIEQAIPCGLMVNELLSNAVKYAFPTGQSARETAARVTVVMRQQDDGLYYLAVSDNGVGLPPGLDVATTKSLGLRLANRLAGQLGGELQASSSPQGTRFEARFPPLAAAHKNA